MPPTGLLSLTLLSWPPEPSPPSYIQSKFCFFYGISVLFPTPCPSPQHSDEPNPAIPSPVLGAQVLRSLHRSGNCSTKKSQGPEKTVNQGPAQPTSSFPAPPPQAPEFHGLMGSHPMASTRCTDVFTSPHNCT